MKHWLIHCLEKDNRFVKLKKKKLDAIQLAANLDREDPKKFDKQNA